MLNLNSEGSECEFSSTWSSINQELKLQLIFIIASIKGHEKASSYFFLNKRSCFLFPSLLAYSYTGV